MNLHDILSRAEALTVVDGPASVLAKVVGRVLRGDKITGLLRGAWLGHPVHPIVVTVPIGAWTGAVVLDATRERTAARKLVGLGLATVPAAVLAGLADYPDLSQRQRRVAVLHATANSVAAALLTASYSHRRADRYATGVLLTLLGLGATGVAGALGGHLSYAQGAGVHRYEDPPG